MIKTDYEQFSNLWIATCGIYSVAPIDTAIGMAFRALVKYELSDIQGALDAHLRDADGGRFSPKPADLIRHIDGDPSSRALEAWTKVVGEMSRTGSYQTVVFDEPQIMAAIEGMGGWITMCEVTEKELPFMRNEFVLRYKGLLNSGLKRWPKKLIGITEAHNQKLPNAKKQEPILLGDQKKALEVYQDGGDKPRLSKPLSQALAQVKNSENVRYLSAGE